MMQEERDNGAYETPNLQALDAELERRIEAVLERKLTNPIFLRMLFTRLETLIIECLRWQVGGKR